LIATSSLREMLSKKARETAVKEFDPKAEIEAYVKIYSEHV